MGCARVNVQSLIADLVSPASPTPGAKRSPPTPGEWGEKGENPRHYWADTRANPGRIGAKKGESPRSPAEPSPEFAQNSPLFAPDSPAFAPQRTRAVTEDSPNSPLSPGVHGGNCSPARGEHAAWNVVTTQGETLTIHTSPPAEHEEQADPAESSIERLARLNREFGRMLDHARIGANAEALGAELEERLIEGAGALAARCHGAQIEPEAQGDPQPLAPDALAVADAYLDKIGETDAEARREYLEELARHPERLPGLFERAVALGVARWPEEGEEAAEASEGDSERPTCASCSHYQRNTVNPAGGLGRCLADAPASRRAGSLWPHPQAWITCPHWQRGAAHE